MGLRMHYCGSLPPDAASTDGERLRWHLVHAEGRDLDTVPCDRDPNWVVAWLQSLRDVPALGMLKPGDFTDQTRLGIYAKRPFHRLTADQLGLGWGDRLGDMLAELQPLRDEFNRPDVRLQVSLPSALDLGFLAFRLGVLRHYRLLAATIRREVSTAVAQYGRNVVWHFETPATLILLTGMPRPIRPVATRFLARLHAGFLAGLPNDTEIILHLCYADLNHQAAVVPTSLRPMVRFANELASRLRERGVRIPPLFVPAAYGDQPPPDAEAFYAPLRDLDRDYPVIAGVVDEHHPDRSATALELFERFLSPGQLFAVCTGCGLGRRSVADAEAAVRLQHKLAGPASISQSPSARD